MEFEQTYEAAWVRWIDRVGYDDGEAQACDWVAQSAARRAAPRILLTGVKLNVRHGDSWAEFLRSGHNATSRSHGRVRGPVLALQPDWKLLDIGRTLARGSALCVMERPGLPMAGWARQVGALNLATGDTANPFTPEQEQALSALAFEGYKGYSDDTSKTMARHYLSDLASAGLADRATVLGALAARGVSAAGLEQIARLKLGDIGRPSIAWNSQPR